MDYVEIDRERKDILRCVLRCQINNLVSNYFNSIDLVSTLLTVFVSNIC